MTEGHLDDPGIRRITKRLTMRQFMLEKKLVVMRFYISQYGMCNITHLDQHNTLIAFAAGASAHLFHQLKGPLVDPEVGEIENAVAIQNAHQIHVVKVQ